MYVILKIYRGYKIGVGFMQTLSKLQILKKFFKKCYSDFFEK